LCTIPYPEVNPENKEAYTRITTIDSITDVSKNSSNNTRWIKLTVTERENVDKNKSKELNAGVLGTEGLQTTYIISTTVENGVEKIISFYEE
jgi:hypothetical protein